MGNIANIEQRGAARRGRGGAIWLAVAVTLAVVLFVAGAPRWWRLVVAVAVGLATNGWLQAREKT